MGLGQRRSIVDAITGHGNNPAFRLELFHDLGLLVRQDFRLHLINIQFASNGQCSRPAVTGQHHHPKTLLVEIGYRLRGRILDGIGHTDQPSRLTVNRKQHDRLALGSRGFCLSWQFS